MLNVWTNINNWFNDSTKGIRQFFLDNTRNPFLWVGLILLGLIVFELTYRALHKEN
jgi:hypothetical protein